MKILKTMPVLLLAAFMATSCGKENSSGGDKGSSTDPLNGVTDFSNGIPGSSGTSQTTIEQVRASFDSKSLGSGMVVNSQIVRSKPQQNSGGFNFSFSFNVGAYNMADDYDIKSVVSASDSSISLKQVTYYDGNSNNTEYGQASALTKSSPIFKEMLLRDNNQCDKIDVAASKIIVTVYENGQAIQKNLNGSSIYCLRGNEFGQFYPTSRSVYSDALPQGANPLFTINESGTVVAPLLKVGNTFINGVQ